MLSYPRCRADGLGEPLVVGRQYRGRPRSGAAVGRRLTWLRELRHRDLPITNPLSCRVGSSDGNTSIWASAFEAAFLSCALLFAQPDPVEAKPPSVQLFEPMRYLGRWYEVASLKKGFAGEGQQDCHCTQGVYVPRKNKQDRIELEVSTFCFHGGPKGRLSGIRGDVTCANPRDLYFLPEFETTLEREEQIREKCVLRFPQIPFVPPEPYDVIRTDYENYAIVQGATDTSFVQIYSRTPKPGKKFIEEQKAFLAKYGYDVGQIRDTPQDCDEIPTGTLMEMMGGREMAAMLTNTVPAPEEEVDSRVRFEGPRNLVQSLTDFFTVLQQND